MNKMKWLSPIRICALLLVLIYHFFTDILPGGFIGVDVFFTLSGFLVTISVIEEFRNTGRFALFSFYKRRFLRLYPPLALCILFSLPFTFLLSPDFIVNIGRQITAALGFVTNYFEILNGGSYEAQLLPHLFLHTWFLAVEVHLYLLWALLCAITALLCGKLYRITANEGVSRLRVILAAVSVTGAVISWLRMQTIYNNSIIDPSAAYFDTGARAFPFLLGACAGSIFTGKISEKKIKSEAAAIFKRISVVCGTALLTCALVLLARKLNFSAEAAYRYGFAASSVLTILLIVFARALHRLTPNTDEPGTLASVSALTYHIYLFHWPLYVVFSYSSTGNKFSFWNNNFAAGAAAAVSVLFSAFVFYCLEPFFHKKLPLPQINSPALRRSLYAVFLMVVMAAIPLNGFVFARAPEINSLEENLHTGYLYQDADKIVQLQLLTEAINDKPLIQSWMLPAELKTEEILGGVTIIGDSVAFGAFMKLKESIPGSYVNAEKSREIWQGYNLIMSLQKNYSLREYVVVSLGTNQDKTGIDYINKIIKDIRPGHRLIFVTPYNGAATEQWNTYKIMQYIRTLPALHPFVTVADWATAAGKQPQLLDADKIHIGGSTGAINLFTNCIIDAVRTAAEKPPKL